MIIIEIGYNGAVLRFAGGFRVAAVEERALGDQILRNN